MIAAECTSSAEDTTTSLLLWVLRLAERAEACRLLLLLRLRLLLGLTKRASPTEQTSASRPRRRVGWLPEGIEASSSRLSGARVTEAAECSTSCSRLACVLTKQAGRGLLRGRPKRCLSEPSCCLPTGCVVLNTEFLKIMRMNKAKVMRMEYRIPQRMSTCTVASP